MNPRLVLTFMLAAGGPLAAHAADPTPPTLRLPDVARPVLMNVDLTILPEQETFDGQVGIDLELRQKTETLWLNARALQITKATLRAGGRETEARIVPGGEDFVGFAFGRELAAGPAHIDIIYRGKLDPIETEGLFREQDGEDWYAFSQFESIFARRAFPCFDEPSYRSPWKLSLHVRASHLAVSNAPVLSERPEGNGMKVVEFALTKPIPSYLVALGVGPFSVVEAGRWGRAQTPIRIVMPRGREGQAAYAAEVTGPLLEALEDYFEIPYAFGKLDNLAIPQTVGFSAMENPGLITYVDRLILADPARQTLDGQRAYAGTAAHENAHQWFGDLVTMVWWDDIWLNEGFATWMGGKLIARWKPEWGGEDARLGRRSDAMESDSLASSQPVRRPIHNNGDIESAFDGISYSKGGSLLSMFESWMGPERFRKGVQRYLKTHSLGNATSADFLAALSAEGAPEVARSFATFLDQAGMPVVSVGVTCTGGQGRLELSQRRYVPLGSPVSKDQLWQVPLNLRYGCAGRTETARVMLDSASRSTDLPFCPEWVQANDGGGGYYVSEYRAGLFEKLAVVSGSLPVSEQITLLDDVRFLFASGELSPEVALGVLPRFADSTNRLVADSVMDLALSIDEQLVAQAVRPNYERLIGQLFGARARRLGFAPRPGESLDETLLRPRVLELLGRTAADVATRSEARRLAQAWFADAKAISPEMLDTVLSVAAVAGDTAFFDRLLAAALAEKDRRIRGQILRALGSFRDPAAVDKGLALVLSGKFDIREATSVLTSLSEDRETRTAASNWIRRSFDALAAAAPEQSVVRLVWTSVGFCDSARRDEVAAFFGPRLKKVSGGENALVRVLDTIGICIDRQAKQQAGVSAFLRRY